MRAERCHCSSRSTNVVGTYARSLAGPVRDRSVPPALFSYGHTLIRIVETTAYEHTITLQNGSSTNHHNRKKKPNGRQITDSRW